MPVASPGNIVQQRKAISLSHSTIRIEIDPSMGKTFEDFHWRKFKRIHGKEILSLFKTNGKEILSLEEIHKKSFNLFSKLLNRKVFLCPQN